MTDLSLKITLMSIGLIRYLNRKNKFELFINKVLINNLEIVI